MNFLDFVILILLSPTLLGIGFLATLSVVACAVGLYDRLTEWFDGQKKCNNPKRGKEEVKW